MEIEVSFPGGVRVDANIAGYTVRTDQPASGGGEGSAPSPFSLFLASMATCAGFYVVDFMRHRGISTEGLRLVERTTTNRATGMVERIDIEITLPEGFPEKYREAVVRAAEQCTVKKHLEAPPRIAVTTQGG